MVKNDIRPDIIFWTGDNSPHNVWSNTENEVIDSTVSLTNMIKGTFARMGVSVYPIQGNHDTWPINFQDFTYPYQNLAINTIGDNWKGWLDPDTLDVYRRHGYYSQTLKLSDSTKLANTPLTKIIGINT